MRSVATWADDIKGGSTARWHFVSLPDDCSYVPERDCPGDACVVEAIKRQASVLSGQAPDEEKLKALKYLIHLVADVHQPLHAGRASDKGGNLHQLRAFGRGTNLHALWDSLLIKHRPGGIDALRASVEARLPSSSDHQASPEAWAIESCQVSRTPDFVPTDRDLAPSYITTFDVVLCERIAQAASRLAWLLTAALRQ
ncbi:S1/P1 nuclease [Roseateles flavus]|uniref:S1/P1 nuclease n=1 Tax=Roseateles flavus TaxID=3149041 RepID=A0ABV0G8G0_9BURK